MVIACLCVILLTVEAIQIYAAVRAGITSFERGVNGGQPDGPDTSPPPAPTETGCPFGEGECGG